MYAKHSLWFAVASIAQAVIVLLSEKLGLSTLGIVLTPTQFLIHILAGQIFGYLLLLVVRNVKAVREAPAWLSGGVLAVIAWFAIYSFNSALGAVNVPWTQGITTIISTLIAYFVFGLMAAYTIKRLEPNNIQLRQSIS